MWFAITPPDNMPPAATPIAIIKTVVAAIAIGALIGLITLGACMVFRLEPSTGILTAFVGLTGQLVGSLTGLLGNTRTQPPPQNGTDTHPQ